MPIRIGDECAKRIEPLKATGIFMRQTPGVSQENSRSSPWVRWIVLNRCHAQYGNTAPDAHAIKSVALEEIMRIGVDEARLSRGYPGLLDLPRARLRAYRPETSIAEKTEAMVRLALANSRMKDFFDIHQLAETRTFDGATLRLAVAATFTRRGIEIPGERPLALTIEFADDAQKKVQWAAFVRRARRPELADLPAIIAALDRFLWPVLQAAARREPWPRMWSNGGPWREP